jgi:hypothetical protein
MSQVEVSTLKLYGRFLLTERQAAAFCFERECLTKKRHWFEVLPVGRIAILFEELSCPELAVPFAPHPSTPTCASSSLTLPM